MVVYAYLLHYISKIKKEVILKSFMGLLVSVTYIVQAIMMAKAVNLVWKHSPVRSILILVCVVLFMVVLRGILTREMEAYGKVLAARIKSKLRFVILDQVFRLGPGCMSAKRSGKVTSLILDGIESLEPFFVNYIPQVVTVLVSGIFIFFYLGMYDLTGSLILLASMVLCIAVPVITIPLINRNVTDYWSGYSVLTAQYIDTIQGMTTLKTLNAEQIKGEELNRDANEFYHKSIRNTGISLLNSALMLILSAVTSSITVVIVAVRADLGLTSSGAVAVFLFLAVECARPMMDLNRYWHSSFLGVSVAGDFFAFVEAEPEVKECERPDCHSLDGKLTDICLTDVSFTYPTGTQAVKDVSLHIRPGNVAALVGHSGSGKSTILNLLLRFYDPSDGNIQLNGVDLKEYSLEYLRKNIAVVFQDSYLFYGTIEDNIRMARPDASREEIIHAAMAANVHEFIESLPEGYQTIVGERGVTLSGGERQRISIARAILKDAPILLLDEATSSVDAKSEALIQKALTSLTRNRTTIIVAHRLSTIQNADQIFVLEDGKLAESGSHQELLEKGRIYHSLIKAQEAIGS